MEVEGDLQLDSHAEGDGEKAKALVVVLVGAPGSGKSTFCEDVTRVARRPWARICQDNIANGKTGTKIQCIKSATDALKHGKSIFIDRCNLDREQRTDFVRLGGPLIDVHAVVLDLPSRLCIARSVKRTGHEGNLQGGKAAAVVNRMLQNKEFPKLNEGFSRITFCRTEKDVQDAVILYSTLGPTDVLPSGCFGEKNMDSKVQLGIMKFLKKVEKPKELQSGGSESQNLISEGRGEDSCCSEVGKNKDEIDPTGTGSCTGVSLSRVHTLAFPSISTSDFQFNHEKASDIIVECVADFLIKYDCIRLVLVDLSHKSSILSLVKAKAAEKKIDSMRFLIVAGDITRLFTERNLQCEVIANATNRRLKPGGGGVNAAIYEAAGEGLRLATKRRADTLEPGTSVAVPLPSCSPLYQREGVTHVIHVLGPNMNPARPDCLEDDYAMGCRILRAAYSSVFNNFISVSRSSAAPEDEGSANDLKMIKREGCFKAESHKRCRGEPIDGVTSLSHSSGSRNAKMQEEEAAMDGGGKKTTWASWAQALHRAAMHPERQRDCVLEISDSVVVLQDLYPKAKKHILVLSRLNGLDSLADARREHLPVLREMHDVGLRWVNDFLRDDPSLIFRLGYHSVPSMRQLHLHVVSQDFDSEHLKNKKHWNSFNTAFFRDSAGVLEDVEGPSGAARLGEEKDLSMELRCHRCRSAHPSVPKLKLHVARCRAGFPSHLLRGGRLVGPAAGGSSSAPSAV